MVKTRYIIGLGQALVYSLTLCKVRHSMQARPAPPSEPLQLSAVSDQSVSVLQLTDCHLGPGADETLLGLNTEQSLNDVLEHPELITSHYDLITCTGDIGSAGRPECYQRFLDVLRRHRQEPLAWLPGNHDAPASMQEVAANQAANLQPESRLVETEHWLIVMLDSSVRGEVYGEFSTSELAFLEQALAYGQDKHVLLMLHHQVEPVGSAWIDQYTLKNSDKLFTLLEANPQVKAVAWGHVHQAYSSHYQQVELLSAPSTCIQFAPNSDDFAVDPLMPGYRQFQLHSDGSLDSQVKRISHREYAIDFQSGGY